ncbi:semaphorin-1A [Schistocerca americana]|uniref:semaphorin-1A n=1 Tax=Schistocerca americana TaxID=7009 RepID=UPI001F4FB583|nr:semaphorin-1A [Schistocerca americana]XP_046999149.1 semaphorin-1A [Schistocerca americana]XP_047116880.1 semaphorin-1A [Schistocerca piceifrons]XP_047116881.1 semaphorin-1A [Schistocerca piceifrons]XP_049964097.1 semaphorin-1A [Schistocerca serialis cubense]XP_049964098.1 semaphorin-1A [Schistocerca serialis cubense]XP_049964099.1 semaphorin-1A [Schistocerca serialis cubense]XP_049964100.1 semaphorin-1A [Schistocerca serialis cubense]
MPGGRCLLVAAALCLATPTASATPWQENVRPKMYVQLGAEEVFRFAGNETYPDYFLRVLRDGTSLLVGGRNLVHNLSLVDLSETQRLTWYSPDEDVKMCIVKGKDEEACQNYIRILAKSDPGKLLVCGTNSFKPVCRDYVIENDGYTLEKERAGQALCPYDPRHNSTAVFVKNPSGGGELYTGTVADFSGMDPIIYRHPLQTEQYDSMSLNAPNFVSSMTKGDFVYFFFRETAVEYINCGKAVYSRVARVCKYDRGGPHRFRNRWTSFLKSRLNCSVQGDFPFYFNEIQSTTELIEGTYGSVNAQLIYGVFTTPPNSISGSAVCAFSLQDITDTFEGNFKEQAELNSNWLPVQSAKVPDPRPGQCVNDSRTLPDLTLNFIKTHSLMDESVPSFFGQPVVIRTSFHYRFSQIAVDPQIKTPGGKAYDVLFIGTDNGKVIKAVNADAADTTERVSPVVIEEVQVFPTHMPVRGLKVVRDPALPDGRLVVVADTEVQALRLHRCYSDKILSCSECVALQDPYCAWDKQSQKCRAVGAPRWSDDSIFIQSIATGVHSGCPASKVLGKSTGSVEGLSSNFGKPYNQDVGGRTGPTKDVPEGEVINIVHDDGQHSGPEVSAADSPLPQYSVETLALAVVAGSVAALVVGFVTGYLCGRKCHKEEEDNLPYPDTEYEYFEQRQTVNRLAVEPKLLPQEEVTYAEPVLVPTPGAGTGVGGGGGPEKLNSPKGTLRKSAAQQQQQQAAETLFQFQDSFSPYGRGRDFGTLRPHDGGPGGGYRRATGPGTGGGPDSGFGTTRSVKKVYL